MKELLSENGLIQTNPIFIRINADQLEIHTVAAADIYRGGYYNTIKVAASRLNVPYKRLWSRLQEAHPRADNGGNRTLLSPPEEEEICWVHRRVMRGHHIQICALQQHTKALLRATRRPHKLSRSWARRFMRRHTDVFYVRKSSTRDTKRKAMQDHARMEKFFSRWKQFLEDEDIKLENT